MWKWISPERAALYLGSTGHFWQGGEIQEAVVDERLASQTYVDGRALIFGPPCPARQSPGLLWLSSFLPPYTSPCDSQLLSDTSPALVQQNSAGTGRELVLISCRYFLPTVPGWRWELGRGALLHGLHRFPFNQEWQDSVYGCGELYLQGNDRFSSC